MADTPESQQRASGEAAVPRRTFLKVGLLGTAVTVVGGAALALQETVQRPVPKAGLRVLSPQEYAVVAAVAECVCPGGAGFPTPASIGLCEQIDGFLAGTEEDIRTQFKLALTLFESGLTAAVFGEGLRPFTQLSLEERSARLRAWRDSNITLRRTVFMSLKNICAGLYYADSRCWPPTGYAGPPPADELRAAFADNLVDYGPLRGEAG